MLNATVMEPIADSTSPDAAAAVDSALARSAAGGDMQAFEALYRRHAGRVHGVIQRLVGFHGARAEDLTQEAFVRAWQALPAFRFESAFGTWLHRIAVNAVLAQARRRGERLGIDGSAEDEAIALPDPSIGSDADRLDIEAAIAGLPAGARQVLVLVGLYGHSHEEAAVMLSIPVGTVRSRVSRARSSLRKRLTAERIELGF